MSWSLVVEETLALALGLLLLGVCFELSSSLRDFLVEAMAPEAVLDTLGAVPADWVRVVTAVFEGAGASGLAVCR